MSCHKGGALLSTNRTMAPQQSPTRKYRKSCSQGLCRHEGRHHSHNHAAPCATFHACRPILSFFLFKIVCFLFGLLYLLGQPVCLRPLVCFHCFGALVHVVDLIDDILALIEQLVDLVVLVFVSLYLTAIETQLLLLLVNFSTSSSVLSSSMF